MAKERERERQRNPLTECAISKWFGTVKRPTERTHYQKMNWSLKFSLSSRLTSKLRDSRANERDRATPDGQRRRQGPERWLERERKLERIHGERVILPRKIFPTVWFRFICFIYLNPFKIPSINYSMLSDRPPSPEIYRFPIWRAFILRFGLEYLL